MDPVLDQLSGHSLETDVPHNTWRTEPLRSGQKTQKTKRRVGGYRRKESLKKEPGCSLGLKRALSVANLPVGGTHPLYLCPPERPGSNVTVVASFTRALVRARSHRIPSRLPADNKFYDSFYTAALQFLAPP